MPAIIFAIAGMPAPTAERLIKPFVYGFGCQVEDEPILTPDT